MDAKKSTNAPLSLDDEVDESFAADELGDVSNFEEDAAFEDVSTETRLVHHGLLGGLKLIPFVEGLLEEPPFLPSPPVPFALLARYSERFSSKFGSFR